VTGEGRRADDGRVIRNVVIHVSNEQPLLADLYDTPASTDASLVCTNVRMLDGKKPIFIDHAASVFVFPYLHIRFIEIPPGASGRPDVTDAGMVLSNATPIAAPAPAPEPEPEPELELDEDFLRRIRDV